MGSLTSKLNLYEIPSTYEIKIIDLLLVMKYTRIKNGLRDFLHRETPDFYIFSYGGCGTRTFFEFVRSRRKLNTQSHVHYGRLEDVPAHKRALYLYGDPRDAVLSFLGRQEKNDPAFVSQHLENLDVPYRSMPSLDAYINNGNDVFELENHFKRHVYNRERQCELMVVRFEEVWDHLEEVLKYVGLADFKEEFPKKRERRSRREMLDNKTRKVLDEYMAQLLEIQRSLPPVVHYPAK